MEKLKSKFTMQREGSSSEDFIWFDQTSRKAALILEMIGTAVMTYSFALSFYNYLARTSAYMICFVLIYHISGAQLNPATTLAVYLKDKWSGKYPTAQDKSNAFKWTLQLMLV